MVAVGRASAKDEVLVVRLKVAVTDLAADIVTWHGPVP
jgi:hypothetical protein